MLSQKKNQTNKKTLMLLRQIQRTEFQVARSFLRIQNSQKRGGENNGAKAARAGVWRAGGGETLRLEWNREQKNGGRSALLVAAGDQ
jgi:hypothetical protein